MIRPRVDVVVRALASFDLQAVPANLAEESEVQKGVAAHRDRYARLDVLVSKRRRRRPTGF